MNRKNWYWIFSSCQACNLSLSYNTRVHTRCEEKRSFASCLPNLNLSSHWVSQYEEYLWTVIKPESLIPASFSECARDPNARLQSKNSPFLSFFSWRSLSWTFRSILFSARMSCSVQRGNELNFGLEILFRCFIAFIELTNHILCESAFKIHFRTHAHTSHPVAQSNNNWSQARMRVIFFSTFFLFLLHATVCVPTIERWYHVITFT